LAVFKPYVKGTTDAMEKKEDSEDEKPQGA
jgi:hypothetical protein